MSDPVWLTVPEVAARVRCHHGLIRQAIKAGKLRAVKVGLKLIIHEEWLEAWLEAQTVNPEAPGHAIHEFRPRAH